MIKKSEKYQIEKKNNTQNVPTKKKIKCSGAQLYVTGETSMAYLYIQPAKLPQKVHPSQNPHKRAKCDKKKYLIMPWPNSIP